MSDKNFLQFINVQQFQPANDGQQCLTVDTVGGVAIRQWNALKHNFNDGPIVTHWLPVILPISSQQEGEG